MSLWKKLLGSKESPKARIAGRGSTRPAASSSPHPSTLPQARSVAALDDSASFHEAVRLGNLEKVKRLLRGNPRLALSKDNYGETPLHLAALNGHKDVAELLLASGAEVNAKSRTSATPLHDAAAGGHRDVAELLLASGAEVNAKTNSGRTPLHQAEEKGHKRVVELLRQHGRQEATQRSAVIHPQLPSIRPIPATPPQRELPQADSVTSGGQSSSTPWAVLSCAGCHKVYRIGDDAVAVSMEFGLGLVRGIVITGVSPADEREDLVSTLEGVSPDRIQEAKSQARLSWETIQPSLSRGDQRKWCCRACNAVNTYPPQLRSGVAESKFDSEKSATFGDDPLQGPSIHEAARDGDLESAKALLHNNRFLVSSRDANGMTPLHVASCYGQAAMAELLLANEAKINSVLKNNGATPLHFAAERGYKNVVHVLLTNEADIKVKNTHGETPLHRAAAKGNVDVVELLLANKANVNAKDIVGETPLHKGAAKGNVDVVELLLANKADVNAKDDGGETPLGAATLLGHADTMDSLRRHGAQPIAALKPWLEELRARLKENPSLVFSKDKEGWTLLQTAAFHSDMPRAKLLLAHGADVNAKTDCGSAPLLLALTSNDTIMAKLLLAHGADVNARGNDDGRVPLHEAALKGNLDVVELLLAHGADVNAKTKTYGGVTPVGALNYKLKGEEMWAGSRMASFGSGPLFAIRELLIKHGGRE